MQGIVAMTASESSRQLGQRIREARKKKEITLVQLSERIGISNQALSDIERGKKNPSKQTLMNLSRELGSGFGIDWLWQQEVRRRKEEELQYFAQHERVEREDLKEAFDRFLDFYFAAKTNVVWPTDLDKGAVAIPLTGVINDEGCYEADEDKQSVLVPAAMTREYVTLRALKVSGDSLRDALISHGDIVVLADDSDLEENKFAAVVVNGKVMLRRLSLRSNKVILRPLNEDYEPISMPLNKVRCFGEVMGVIRVITKELT